MGVEASKRVTSRINTYIFSCPYQCEKINFFPGAPVFRTRADDGLSLLPRRETPLRILLRIIWTRHVVLLLQYERQHQLAHLLHIIFSDSGFITMLNSQTDRRPRYRESTRQEAGHRYMSYALMS